MPTIPSSQQTYSQATSLKTCYACRLYYLLYVLHVNLKELDRPCITRTWGCFKNPLKANSWYNWVRTTTPVLSVQRMKVFMWSERGSIRNWAWAVRFGTKKRRQSKKLPKSVFILSTKELGSKRFFLSKIAYTRIQTNLDVNSQWIR